RWRRGRRARAAPRARRRAARRRTAAGTARQGPAWTCGGIPRMDRPASIGAADAGAKHARGAPDGARPAPVPSCARRSHPWPCPPGRCRRPDPPGGSAMTSRREFLSAASLAATGLVLAPLAGCSREGAPTPSPAAPAAPPVAAAGPMITRAIPSTGEALPVIGAGTSGSYEVPLDSPAFDALKEVARIFFEGGGSVIDTAPNYGNAEDVVGALLADGGWRERCFLATKLAADSREALEAQWAESLRRLRTGRVELLAVHNLRNLAEALPFARELKEQGLVRYVGLTHYQASAHAELLQAM